MKISKQLLLITLILFIFFSSGCSKNLLQLFYAEPNSEFIKEENAGEVETSSGPGDSGKEGNDLLSKGGDKKNTPDLVGLFLPKKGGDIVASLPPAEEASRRLSDRSSDPLLDMVFTFDSYYSLDEQLLAILEKNVDYLESHPNLKIEIQGHCDEGGNNNYIPHGEQPAAHSVMSYFILLGVDESRIHVVSNGEKKAFCFENRVSFLVAG